MSQQIKLGCKTIKKGGKPFFIADLGANHDGDIKRAFKLIELAKESGADIAKFQNFKASKIISKNGFDSIPKQSHQSAWTKSVFEVYEDASLEDSWSEKLFEKCQEVDIGYMTSPYDYQSVDLADKYSEAFKIGSGDITWTDIIEYIAQKNKPVLLATGACDMEDVERAVQAVTKYNSKIVLMQCNTNYTALKDNFQYINLNVLKYYNENYPECILGLSDHMFGYTTVLGAIALGATVIEKHFTDDNSRIGPDHKFAMNPISWSKMVTASNDLYAALGDGIKKVEQNEKDTVIVQQRVFYTTKDLKKGQIITEDDIFPLRPIKKDGIYPYEKLKIIGKKISKDVMMDTCITWEDIENVKG